MKHPLKLAVVLEALPPVDDLVPLREALLAASGDDPAQRWGGAERYQALGGRVANLDAVEGQAASLAEEIRRRAAAMTDHALAALRSLERGDAAGAALALVRAGEVQEAAGRLDEAGRLFTAALAQGRRPRDRRAEGLALRRLARVARAQGRTEEAARQYRRGLQVAEAQRDTEGAVVACQGLGNVAVDQGLWLEARDWYARGLAMVGEEGEPSVLRWQLLANLAVAERRAGRMEAAEEWLRRAASEAERGDDPVGRHYAAHGWGRLHLARGEFAAAAQACGQALALPADAASRIAARLTLAEALLGEGQMAGAEQEARAAEREALAYRLVGRLPDVYRALGKVAQARGDAEGFVFFEQALSVCREQALPRLESAMVQHDYGRFERRMGNREAARDRLRAALEGFTELGSRAEAAAVEAELSGLDDGDTLPENG